MNHSSEEDAGNLESEARLRKMRAIADRGADLPILDERTDNEILGYDSLGLPS